MKQLLRILDYKKFLMDEVSEDHSIEEQIFIMDEYSLDPISDFSFTPLKNLFIEVIQGKGYVIVNDTKFPINGHCLIAYLKGQNIRFKIQGHKTIQRGVAFSDTFMESLYMDAVRFNDVRSAAILNPVVQLAEEQSYGLDMYVNVLKELAQKHSNPNNLTCAKLLTLALFYGPLNDVLLQKLTLGTSRSPSLSSGFFSLLEKHFKEEHTLRFYANALNISEKYLYTCVSTTSGRSPSYWIDNYMLTFAKQNLSNMDFSITQIALMLHFAGLPQFSKFFKRHTGITPSEYRKNIFSGAVIE